MTRKSRSSNKRKKSDSSKSGDTPPGKINMAASMSQQQQQQQVDISQILAQAHDSIYRSQQSLSGSPVMPQQLVFPNPSQAGLQTPDVQSNAPPIQIRHSTPVLENSYHNNFPPPAVTHGNILPPPPIAITPVNMQTLFANIALINDRLEKFDNILSDKLPKLDVLDTMNKKLDNFERTINNMKDEINKIKNKQQQQEKTISQEEMHHHNIEDRVRQMERHNQHLETENKNLKEDFLRLKTHSMKYNLIFGGIEQTQEYENTKEVLVNFMRTELGIHDAININFQNVHRLSRRNDGKPRNIIARFANYSDHERILKEVPKALKNKVQFSVNQQYPTEIGDRRRALIPDLKYLQRQGVRAKLVYDQIYVNGTPYERRPPRTAPQRDNNTEPINRE